jgi:hypothetical protein
MVLLFELPICKKALGKKFCFAMLSLWRAAAVRRQFRPGIAGFRLGRVGEWSRAHPRSGTLVGRGQGCSGERPRRCRSAPAAGLPAPACARPGRGSGRLEQLPKRLGGWRKVNFGSWSAGNWSSPRLAQGRRRTARCGGEGWCASRPGAVAAK